MPKEPSPRRDTRLPKNNLLPKNELGAEVDDSLVALMDVLDGINENKPSAKLNETSMIASNGGRVYF